ncbi:MAG: hypothetical protein AB8F94_14460 [Saprospiraceae bacterium]
MILLEFNGQGLEILVFIIAMLWLIPIVMLIIGIAQLKTKPRRSKILMIIAGIWLIIGLGVCGSMYS